MLICMHIWGSSASAAPSAAIYHRHAHALEELVALLLPPPSTGFRRRRVGHDLTGSHREIGRPQPPLPVSVAGRCCFRHERACVDFDFRFRFLVSPTPPPSPPPSPAPPASPGAKPACLCCLCS